MVSTSTQRGIAFGSGTPVKATIWNEDKNEKVVDCMFNPTSYKFERTNVWSDAASKQIDTPLPSFDGAKAMKLTVSDLLFDTYVKSRSAAYPEDVRTYTEKLFDLMQIDPSTVHGANDTPGRPPRVSFRCGRMFTFKAVITSVSQNFTLFWTDGRPIRAKVNITFQQIESQGTYPNQNPTSHGLARKVRVVGPNETIDSIAYLEYGDASRWRLIADYNRLDNPMRLRAGQRLVIPLES
jgi:nucleoid-associated protein YgaU